MAEQDAGNDVLEAVQCVNKQGSEQGGNSSQVSTHDDASRQVLTLTGYNRHESVQSDGSRQKQGHSGGSRREFEQRDNIRDELREVGEVVEEPGIEVQRDTNEEAVLTGLVSTQVELAQDILMEEVPDLCKCTRI